MGCYEAHPSSLVRAIFYGLWAFFFSLNGHSFSDLGFSWGPLLPLWVTWASFGSPFSVPLASFWHPFASKIALGGAPRRFRKAGRQKNAQEPQTLKQMAPKWDPKSQGWRYFLWYFSIFSCIIFEMNFEWYFWWVLDRFLHVFHDLLGCLLVSFWN